MPSNINLRSACVYAAERMIALLSNPLRSGGCKPEGLTVRGGISVELLLVRISCSLRASLNARAVALPLVYRMLFSVTTVKLIPDALY